MRFTAAVLLTLTVVLLALTLLDVTGTARVTLTVLFGLVAPGWALTAFFLPLRPSIEWTLATALSLVVSAVLSVTLLVLHVWHPAVAMAMLAAVTSCALTWHLLRPTPAVHGILDVIPPLVEVPRP
jgi:uncharacterized membrane protein